MGTANSTLNATKLDAEGANMIIEIKKEETKEPEMDWSGQGSREELKGTVCKEDLERAKQAVTEATEATRKGNNFFLESRLDLAKIHYSWAMKVLQNKLSNVQHHKATALSNIGLVEFAEGRYSEAKALLSEAHLIRTKCALEESNSDDHIGYKCDFLEGLQSLTVVLNSRHQMMFWPSPLSDQLRLCVALKEDENVVIAIADSLNNLAACMEMMGDLEEAEPLYRESLRIKQTIYGDMSLKVAGSMQNLVTVSSSRGHLKEAENMLRKASCIYNALLGEDSPEVAIVVNNLAVTLCRLGDMDQAQILLEQTVIIRVSVSGENDVLTKCTKQNLEYIINKKNSIAISLTGKKGKGRKVILEKKVKAEKENVGVVSEVKETVKDINQIEPNKPMCNNTVVVIENDTMKMRNTKNATREAACTDVCCSVI